jgi:hypothetical protein
VTAALARVASALASAPPTVEAPRTLAAWLLDGGVQQPTGPEAGGVAGWLCASGSATYVYPEITGYYLQWLAWQTLREGGTSAALRSRAAAAQRWLRSWALRGERPPTRVYLREDEGDWRNAAVFFFDIAMIVRGIASATSMRLIEPDAALVERLADLLLRLADDDGQFKACMATLALPLRKRWSTRRGGFLTKAAAGVLSAARVLPQIAPLQPIAEATLVASLRLAVEEPHPETHPLLYAIEGALCVPGHRAVEPVLDALAAQVEGLLRLVSTDGRLPESHTAPGIARLDIVAQTLRATGLLRRRARGWYPHPRVLDRMSSGLLREVRLDGALPMDPTAQVPQYNAWCAMFADQALQVAQHRYDGPILDDLEACLV